MITVGTFGEYILSIDFQAEIPDVVTYNNDIMQNVASDLSSMTLSSIKNLVSLDSTASNLLEGFDNYKAATVWDLKNIMSSSSLNNILNSCVSALAIKARQKISPQKLYKSLVINMKESDFVSFVLEEHIGLVLPMYKFSFLIYDKALLKYINNSLKLKLGFGQSENEISTFNANVFDVETTDMGDKINVTLYGFLDCKDYLTVDKKIAYRGTSLEVLQKSLPLYNLKLNTNITQTNDNMNWKQSNLRPLDYYIELWKHSYISETHPICTSITSEGKFNFIDIQQRLEKEIKSLKLSSKLYFKQEPIYANFGSMNNSKYVYDIKKDTMSFLSLNRTGGLSKTLINPQQSGNRVSRYAILTPELHQNWYSAAMINQSKLYSCINMTAWTTTLDSWTDYNVCDIVDATSLYSEDAGRYLITGKTLSIVGRSCDVYIQLGRETYSKSTGSINIV